MTPPEAVLTRAVYPRKVGALGAYGILGAGGAGGGGGC